MKQSIFKSIKPLFLLSILIFVSFSFSELQKKTIAYSTKINGKEVIICPVNKVTDTIQLPLSSLIESCEIVKLQTTPEAFFDRAYHTAII